MDNVFDEDHNTIITEELKTALYEAYLKARSSGNIAYLCYRDNSFEITGEYPMDRRGHVATFWPGGRRVFRWPVSEGGGC
jgi:hypothetical protein